VIGEGDRSNPIWNLETGRGHSVLDVITTFERVNGVLVPHQIVQRRPGDVVSCYASVDKARRELGWRTSLSLDEMVGSAWRFGQLLSAS
jgi:UDP-glucose 4-epimerase